MDSLHHLTLLSSEIFFHIFEALELLWWPRLGCGVTIIRNHWYINLSMFININEYIIYPIFLLDIRFSIVFILDLKAWSKHRFDVKRHRMRGMWPYFSNMYSSSSKICGPTSQICPGSQILCRCLDYFSSQICSGTRLFRHCIDLLYKLTSWIHPALLLKISWLWVFHNSAIAQSADEKSVSRVAETNRCWWNFFFVNCDNATK